MPPPVYPSLLPAPSRLLSVGPRDILRWRWCIDTFFFLLLTNIVLVLLLYTISEYSSHAGPAAKHA